jgi:phosphatidylglycerol---prolipoprotein diacylglyceryl transferase
MIWNSDPVLFHLGGSEVRYYGVLVLVSAMCAIWAMVRWARGAGVADGRAVAMGLLGLGSALLFGHAVHVLAYEPESIGDADRWLAIGSGFASHGAYAGGLAIIALYAVIARLRVWSCLDVAMSAAVVMIPFFRVGNLMNSEIVGRQWNGPWAMAFPRYDCGWYAIDCDAPLRHPVQIYEALAGFAVIVLAEYLHWRWRDRLRPGVIFGVVMLATFASRFATEAFKEYQLVDPILTFTMGQVLSVPFIVLGAIAIFTATRR